MEVVRVAALFERVSGELVWGEVRFQSEGRIAGWLDPEN